MPIRPILPTDAPTWAQLRQELWPEHDDTHQKEVGRFFRGELPDVSAVLMAESDDGQVIGFAELSIRRELPGCSSDRIGYVEGLYVVPEARHQGVGRALVRASRDWARQQGCPEFASDRADRIVIDRTYP